MTQDPPGSEPEHEADFDPGSGPRGAMARSRYVPAILDALIPGLGHLVAGRPGRALLFLAPILIAVLVTGYLLATTSLPRLAASMLDNGVIIGLLALQGLLLVWRLLAVGSSLLGPGLSRPGRRDAIPVAILLVAIIAPQVFAGAATEQLRESADEVFVEPSVVPFPSGSAEPDPSYLETPSPTASGLGSPSPSPSASPTVPRLTGLIIGVDSGVGRSTYLTDTMIVVSLDTITNTVAMASIPRDMVDVPLADGRTFRGKINGLVAYARNHPKQFPGTDGTGFDVLMGALGKLLKVDISYYATVNLGGFVSVVDRLGGVDVNVARSFCDPHYKEYGYEHGFSIQAGHHHLNGFQALAYARVRKPNGESDFTRAARQQEVLSGIRDSIEDGGFLRDPIGLIKDLGKTVSTNVPRKILPDLADAASKIGRSDTYRAVITHPLVKSGFDGRGSIQLPVLKRIRALSDALFPPSGTLPDAKYRVPKGSTKPATTSGVSSCRPAATPKPTPRPTKKPTPTPATPTPSLPPSESPDPAESSPAP